VDDELWSGVCSPEEEKVVATELELPVDKKLEWWISEESGCMVYFISVVLFQ